MNKNYWDENYSEPQTMDGLGNAKDHALYFESLSRLHDIPVRRLADFGFGLGEMLRQFDKVLRPDRIFGIEPSDYAFEKLSHDQWYRQNIKRCVVKKLDLQSWIGSPGKNHFDLGICYSVFQYLPDHAVSDVLSVLSKKCRYLYFSVPTRNELKQQREQLQFNDSYARRRTRQFYLEKIQKHFTFVSEYLLESRFFNDYTSSNFSDELFRF